MSGEFEDIIFSAGEWAKGLRLLRANYNQALERLEVFLHSDSQLDNEQIDTLNDVLKQRFENFDTCVFVETTPLPVAKNINVQPEAITKKKEIKPQTQRADKPIYGSRVTRRGISEMALVSEESGKVTVEGHIVEAELKALSKGSANSLAIITITDYTNTMIVKAFLSPKEARKTMAQIEQVKKDGGTLLVSGQCMYDKFSRDLVIRADGIMGGPGNMREDNAKVKRVELHLHTQMSSMDGITNITSVIERAAKWGHKAIAVTDHGVAQAFPEAAKSGAKHGVKILYGIEGYLKPDTDFIPLEQSYVVFDIETTGLYPDKNEITEIGAVKLCGGEVVGTFSTFVNAGVPIPPDIVKLTGIDESMLIGAPHTREALIDFYEFTKGSVLVAHNASFDIGFIKNHGKRYGIVFDGPYADTLMLSKYLLFGLENNKLNTVCAHMGIELIGHHRAVNDAEATAKLFLRFLGLIEGMGVTELPVYTTATERKHTGRRERPCHVIILAKTSQGLKNLYRLVSGSHINFFHSQRPQIPKSFLHMFRNGLIVGSACEQGELVQAIVRGESESDIENIASWYDYLEIQPIGNNAFLVREGLVNNEEGLRGINRQIVSLGEKLHKPVAATGDVHFLDPRDDIYRAIIQNFEGYKDAHLQAPLYYRTTEEMLCEFEYLGEEKAYEVVVTTPNAIAGLCESLKPYPDGTFAPRIEGAEDVLREMALNKAHEIYGETLPEPVQKVMDKELRSIIDNGFSSLYLVAQKLVQKSIDDGYLVGSRGSVGSSLVATMLGITEVNPLPPHYVCPNCKKSDFDIDRDKYACGVDMPGADCPSCGTKYKKEGFDIPFEVFLGFHGDKTPDIDLNFSGEYQSVAHKFTEEMFGRSRAYRAGTISSIQAKTAYGMVKKYAEEYGLLLSRLEMNRLCEGCTGVKRTTGQHPGGIVIVPQENEILEFTPVQYPSDQQEKGTITTHFDFHALDDRLVKLDILGHVDPTALRMLQDLTGLDPRAIPLDDGETLSLFSDIKALGVDLSDIDCYVGSLGLPEFGTSFVRQMLMETRPTTMEELVRIAGLSHGTDVWINNAQLLIKNNTATLFKVICTRDDIMNSLIAAGCDSSASFKIMENVRKGKGLSGSMEIEMRAHEIPQWFIESCNKIKYMFPRAHAVAYVMMSFRIAYFKVHFPKEYYAVYYTVRSDTFDMRVATGGPERVLAQIKEIKKKNKDEKKETDSDLLTLLEVVYEMNLRGIAMLPVDIYKSHATKFLVEDGGIRAPFSALDGVGKTVAEGITKNIDDKPFISVEDFKNRTNAGVTVITALEEIGCFDGFPKTNQISLF